MDIVIVAGNTSLRIDPDLPGIEIQTLVEEAGMDLLEVCRTVGTVGAKLWDLAPPGRKPHFRSSEARDRLLQALRDAGGPLPSGPLADRIAGALGLPRRSVQGTLGGLVRAGCMLSNHAYVWLPEHRAPSATLPEPERTKGLGATQRLALGVLEETASRGGLLVEDFILDNVARAIPRGAGRDRRREKAHKALDALVARGLVLREGRRLRLADTGEDLC